MKYKQYASRPLKRKYQKLPVGLRRLSAYFLYLKLRRMEIATYHDFNKVYTLSKFDQHILHKEDPALLTGFLPSAIITPPLPTNTTQNTNMILFVGAMYREENIEGVWFMINKVMPLVLKQHPNAEFHIVGSGVPPEIQKRHDGKHFFIHGYVKDLSQFYGTARVMAVPLFVGGGIIIKLLEALSYGVPTVATPIANEGVAGTDGLHLLVASTPEAFSSSIGRLLNDDAFCAQLSNQSKQFVQTTMNLETITANLVKDYETIIAKKSLKMEMRICFRLDIED